MKLYQNSIILSSEIVRLKNKGFSRLEIARQILAMKGVVNHWVLWNRYGVVGNSATFQIPLP